jgi:hypothetical protein
MRHARLSLFYLAGYLIPTGLALIFAPDLTFKLLFSNGHYGDVIPRVAGGAFLALGILVVQIIRQGIDSLYLTMVGVRVMLVGLLVSLYVYARDPFFLVVTGVVSLGLLLTTVGYLMDRAPSGAQLKTMRGAL